MLKIFYRLFTFLYPISVGLVSPFNQKARFWSAGRKRIFERMEKLIEAGSTIIWVHCSSLGEFEQGRPLIERLRRDYPSNKILLTFFSPSGYEVRKDYEGADYIFYLPTDSKQNASRFFNVVKPRMIVFVKYEFWFYYLDEARRRNVPLLLISAIFRKEQPFFKRYGAFHRQMLSCFLHLFVQNEASLLLLRQAGFTNASVAGDTRFDRVIEIAEQFEPLPLIESFCGAANVIVAGSTWLEDDKEFAHYANSRNGIKFIIAPHSIIKDRLQECLKLYKNAVLFSGIANTALPANINTLIIDNVGMLSRLYRYSTVSYIGGGFGADGVHNVLEAAVYGKPVVFGPEYEKFIEASGLINNGGATSINNALELEAVLDQLLKKDNKYEDGCKAASSYVYSQKGSTDRILKFIQENRLLTK